MADEMPPPILLAVIAADYIHRDPASGRSTIVSIIRFPPVPEFPHTIRGIWVYLAVTEVTRATRIKVSLVSPNDQPVGEIFWDLQLMEPLFVYEAIGMFGDVSFNIPGTYFLRACVRRW